MLNHWLAVMQGDLGDAEASQHGLFDRLVVMVHPGGAVFFCELASDLAGVLGCDDGRVKLLRLVVKNQMPSVMTEAGSSSIQTSTLMPRSAR